MDAEIKAQWVKDLRSGEFEQGTGKLKRNGKYCCLGVLCVQAVKAGIIEETPDSDGTVWFDGNPDTLSRAVIAWCGVSESNPAVTLPDGSETSLAELNDGENIEQHSFVQLADLIEGKL